MEKKDTITMRQMVILSFIVTISPAIKMLPRETINISGGSAWLSSLLTVIPLSALILVMGGLLKKSAQHEGLCEVTLHVLGPVAGRIILALFLVWIVLQSGSALKTSSDRIITNLFNGSSHTFFLVAMTAMALIAAMGRVSSISRTANIFAPVLFISVIVILIFIYESIDLNNLHPINRLDAVPVIKGVYPSAAIMATVVMTAFLDGHVTNDRSRVRGLFIWMAISVALISLICFLCLGVYGKELAGTFVNPLFVLVHDIRFLDTVERIESLVVVLWVAIDFVQLTVLFIAARKILSAIFRTGPEKAKYYVAGVALCSLVIASLAGGNVVELTLFSRKLMPAITFIVAYGLLPAIFITGKIRKRL